MTSTKCDAELAFTNDLQNKSPADLINPGHTTRPYMVAVWKDKSRCSSGGHAGRRGTSRKPGAPSPSPQAVTRGSRPGSRVKCVTATRPVAPTHPLLKPTRGVKGSSGDRLKLLGSRGKATDRGDGNRRPCTSRGLVTRQSGRYRCRASKQTQESERRGRGGGETRPQASIGAVGTRGAGIKSFLGGWRFPACSRPARQAAAVRQRERSGQVPGDPPGAGPGGGRGPGRLNKAGARGAWLLTTRSSCRPRLGLRARRSRGLGTAAARPGEQRGGGVDEEEAGSAGCSAAATCLASLVPMARRGGGSGKRTA